jgi:hypothetical protein
MRGARHRTFSPGLSSKTSSSEQWGRFPSMLARDRTRFGLRLARAARLLGVSVPELRELEAGKSWPDFDTHDRICKLFGWPEAFVGESGQVEYR